MTEVEKNPTIYSLNWLRAIASLSVLFFHLTSYIWKGENVNFLVKASKFGQHGVTMFFIISGFVIPYSLYVKKYKIRMFFSFLLKRTLRIEPPFVVCAIIMLVWAYYSKTILWHQHFEFNLSNFLLNITYLAPFFKVPWISIIFWTLAIEFQFYVIMGVLFPLLMKHRLIKYFIYAGLLVLSCTVPRVYQTVFTYIIYFIIGFETFSFYTKQIHKLEFFAAILLSLGFIIWKLTPVTIYVVLFTLPALFLFTYKHKIVDFFGNISYSLYLLHAFLGGIILAFIPKSLPPFGKFTCIVLGSIAISYIYYLLVERLFLKLSKKVKY